MFGAADLRCVAVTVDLVVRSTGAASLLAALEALVPLDAITVWPSDRVARTGRSRHLSKRGVETSECRHRLEIRGRDGRSAYTLVVWRRSSSDPFDGRESALLEAVAPFVARVAWRHGAPSDPARTGASPAGSAGLTPREERVSALVARGHSNGEIAYALGVSEHTVKQHLKSAFRKLDVRGRTELALLLARDGCAGCSCSPAGTRAASRPRARPRRGRS